MRLWTALLALGIAAWPILASAADDIVGTCRLVSSQRRSLVTGAVVDTYGAHPTGYITYGADGRVLGLIVYDGRPKAASVSDLTERQKAELFSKMLAYGGTYTYDGKSVAHRIDISWNEVWTGTTVIRDVAVEDGKLVYTTKPAPFSGTGEMSVITLVWEKVRG